MNRKIKKKEKERKDWQNMKKKEKKKTVKERKGNKPREKTYMWDGAKI